MRLTLLDGQGQHFMGIGVYWLLAGIDRHRSIREAAREMELSYPKALRMLAKLEAGIGHPILVRHKGGSQRGGTELTSQGRDLLGRYADLLGRVRRFADGAFAAAFAAPLEGGGG
ncbi:MAG TPA: LysR family transcriptional regulator [Myxococcota bacterium]|nr:LysR family transcriptional regulator [Myxococcota bacterium]